MGDERKAYAGDLGSDVLGRTVIVPAHGEHGERRGVVQSVSHFLGLTGKPVTSVLVTPLGSIGVRQVWTVDATVVVEVKAARVAVAPAGGDAA